MVATQALLSFIRQMKKYGAQLIFNIVYLKIIESSDVMKNIRKTKFHCLCLGRQGTLALVEKLSGKNLTILSTTPGLICNFTFDI